MVMTSRNPIFSNTRHFMQRRITPRQCTSQGFTMIEVVVGTLLMLAFTGVAMQTMVAATAMRVRSQETSEAANWIQDNIESVKPIANGMDFCPSGSTDTSCAGIDDNFKTDVAKCSATSAGTGYANDLKNILLASTDIAKTSQLGGRPYVLRRVTAVKNTAPYSILSVNYSVYRGTTVTGTPINTFYTEVVPGVAFACR